MIRPLGKVLETIGVVVYGFHIYDDGGARLSRSGTRRRTPQRKPET